MNLLHRSKLLVITAMISVIATEAMADLSNLSPRSGPVPATTNGVPHVQIGITPSPDISAELLVRVSKLPGVEIRETVISLPGAKGFWINDDVIITRPQVIVGGREFAHMHPDGSLHASLSPELARMAVKLGWATRHPWADQRAGWEGFVMIYTPTSKKELDVVVQLVSAAYGYVTESS